MIKGQILKRSTAMISSTDWNFGSLTDECLEDYQCFICYGYPQNREFYQCIEGHIACKSCWERNLESKNECMFCKCKVQDISQLSRSRFIEKQFSKKLVWCPNLYGLNSNFFDFNVNGNSGTLGGFDSDELVKDLENGCPVIIKIEGLDSHTQDCSFRFVECNNKVNGCTEIIRFNQVENHDSQCEFKLVECNCCSNFILRKTELYHYNEECPSVLVSCVNCPEKVKRFLLDEHVEKDCENSLVHCKFSDYGCKSIIKRVELASHLELINHSVYFEKYLDKVDNQLSYLVNSNKQLSDKLELMANKMKKDHNKIQHYSNRWTIRNISSLLGTFDVGESIESPPFQIGPFKFNFNFYPYRIDDEIDSSSSDSDGTSDNNDSPIDDKYYCSIFLNNLTNTKTFKFKYSITLENVNSNDSITLKCENEFNQDLQSYGFVQTLLSSDLSNENNGWISNNSISFNFKITIIHSPKELYS